MNKTRININFKDRIQKLLPKKFREKLKETIKTITIRGSLTNNIFHCKQ
jgi:DNA-binding transcriptional regulator/RsmH inhibitor MraZ